MSVHLVADTATKIAELGTMLAPHGAITSTLLGNGESVNDESDSVVVAVDLKIIDNLAALKKIVPKFKSAKKKIFVIDAKTRLLVFQAYALGATRVIPYPSNQRELLATLVNNAGKGRNEGGFNAAATGSAAISSMMSSVMDGNAVDVARANVAAGKIADSVASDGLSGWLETVRSHHEGTYQHCLLVTGIAADFGLLLGLARKDMERLYSAAMFHDIGKAKIPIAVLDKPGTLAPEERALIETHPAAGYRVLKGTPGISPEILDAVLHHHEFLDGSGYPDALCAANIPDLVRILTISDIFAALIENRRYKPPMARETAYEVLRGMRGKLESPLVAAFKDVALVR